MTMYNYIIVCNSTNVNDNRSGSSAMNRDIGSSLSLYIKGMPI